MITYKAWGGRGHGAVLLAALSLAAVTCRPAHAVSPLSIEEAIALASRHNPRLRSAHEGSRAAQARVGVSGAPARPDLRFDVSRERSFQHTSQAVSAVDGSVTAPRTTQRTVGLRSNVRTTQLVTDFQRTRSDVRSQRHRHEAARQNEQTTIAQVVVEVRLAYVGVLLAQRNLDVARETTRQRKDLLGMVERLHRGGVRPRVDVSRSRLDFKSAEIAELSAEAALARSRYELYTAVGLPDLGPRPLVDDLDGPWPPSDARRLVGEALRRRPEVLAAEAQVRAARAALRVSRAGLSPRVETTAEYTHTDASDGDIDEWSVRLGLSLPVFDGRATRHRIRESAALLRQAQADLEGQQNQVVGEVRQRIVEVEEARARAKEAEELVVYSRENLDLARKRYLAGIGRIIDVTDAQANLTSSLQGLHRARADVRSAGARLDRATQAPLPPGALAASAAEAPIPTAADLHRLGEELLAPALSPSDRTATARP